MPIGIIWMVVKAFFSQTLIPYLAMVPRWVWIALAVAVGTLYYGHYTAEQARMERDAYYAGLAQKEKDRQAAVFKEQLQDAHKRAEEANKRANELDEALQNVTTMAHKAPTATNDCLPDNVTDGLRNLQLRGRGRGSSRRP